MSSRLSRAAGVVLACCTAAAAQSGRTLELTAPPRIGSTLRVTIRHPVAAAGLYYEALFSLPTAAVTDFGLPFIVGQFRLDPLAFGSFTNGFFGPGGSTVIAIPVPNDSSLLGGGFDLQTIDVDIAGPTIAFADNDLEIRPFAGVCRVHLATATNRSPVEGDNDVRTVTDASIGTPVSQGMPPFAFQSIQHRGQEGYVEGYASPFTGISHNSDIEVFTGRRVAKRTANPAFQVVSLPNGYDIGIVRQRSNTRHFSIWSYRRSTGVATIVPNSTVVDSGPLNQPASNLMPYVAFTSDGTRGVVIAHDTNPAVADRVLTFLTDASAPAVDITATTPVSATYFDGSALFTADFLLIGGSGGWYWTSASAPGRLARLTLPNTTATNGTNRWVYSSSWRVSRDGSAAWFPIGSATSPRSEMDIVRVTANGGVPRAVNVTRFPVPTAVAEFGSSAVTPAADPESSFGIKAALSPDGTKLAFLGMGASAGVHVVAESLAPIHLTVPGAAAYAELTFLGASTVMFCAGVSPDSQDVYRADITAQQPQPVALSTAGDIKTRGQFWSQNRNWFYFVRSNAAGTVNDVVGVDARNPAPVLKDITGSEFSNGTAPSLRTGGLNTTPDPWPALEFQMRRVPLWDYVVFTARRAQATPAVFEDANLFRFDIERGEQATMLTSNTTTGASWEVLNMESLALAGDPLFAAWAQRRGWTAAASEDVFTVSVGGGGEVRRKSLPDPAGQSIVDGSIHFTCFASTSLVWAVGHGRTDVPEDDVRVEWTPLGTSGAPVRLTPAPLPARVWQILGTSF